MVLKTQIFIYFLVLSTFSVFIQYTNAAESIPDDAEESTSDESTYSVYNIVCYVRIKDLGIIDGEIDTHLCTHMVYYPIHLNRRTLTLDSAALEIFYRRYGEQIGVYKASGIKVSIQLSEWETSAGTNAKYFELVSNETARSNFIEDANAILPEYNLNGLELQWQYPICWDEVCVPDKSPPSPYLNQFVKEMSELFADLGLLLSLFMAGPQSYDEQHDIAGLSEHLDWIVVTTLASKHRNRNVTALHHPLYQHPLDNQANHNMASTLNHWIHNGADPRKLAMYIPTYLYAYRLENAKNFSLNAPAINAPNSIPVNIARSQGCQLINQGGWTIERDASNKYGFYAHKDDLWITFDDAVIARNKAIYIHQNKLFGAAIGTLDEDDEDDQCGGGEHPILQEIDNIFTFVLDMPVISSSTEGKTSPNIETYEANNTSPPTIIRPTVSRNVILDRKESLKMRLRLPLED